MSIKDFILQGITAQSHSVEIKKMFSEQRIEHAILSVAFLTNDGVQQLKDIFYNIPKSSQVLVGISNGVTSYQGLTALLLYIKGFYVVDTGTAGVIFHPKLYFLRTASMLKTIVGSANLTLGGLNNNIEASAYIELGKDDENFSALVNKVEDTIGGFILNNPKNIRKITLQSEIDELFSSSLLVDESVQRPSRDTIGNPSGTKTNRPKSIKLKTQRIPSSVRKGRLPSAPKAAPSSPLATSPFNMDYLPVWRSKELTERDLNIPQGSNTHTTGSINLDKGFAPPDMDHRHYFKDEVFNRLSWKEKGETVVEATAKFLLEIKGIYRGEFPLNIRHTTSTDTKAYRQRNAMTRLSWGDAKPYIADRSLLGCLLTLSISTSDPSIFLISID